MTKIKIASGLVRAYMKACGFKGWASFWHTIYVMPGYENAHWLIRHETKHLEQIEREGRVMFSLKYIWWTVRYGYFNNPYECEARQAEALILPN